MIRDTDDGLKIMHPGEEILEQIIDLSEKQPQMSDRRCGRKIYRWLHELGFHIETRWDLYSIDELGRQETFEDQFIVRCRAIFNETDLKEMERLLERFRDVIMDERTYYHTGYMVFIGSK